MKKILSNKNTFIGSIWLLVLIGVVMRYSILGVISEEKHGWAGAYLVKEEFMNLLVAFCAFWFCSRLKIETLAKWGRPLMLVTILILVVVISGNSMAHSSGVATRWIRFPFIGSVQPSELAKVSLIIFMAGFLTRHRHDMNDWKKGFAPVVLILSALFLLVIAQPDFGTAVLLFVTGVWMMMVAGMRVKHFVALMVVAIPSALFFIFSSAYRTQRVVSFFNPQADLENKGYHANQMKWAITNGGDHFPMGQGLMNGVGRLGYVPEASTDSIASIYIEEMGLIGLVFMIVLFTFVIRAVMLLAIKRQNYFDQCLLTGIGGILSMQVMINLFVVTDLMPNKGMPLPLISSGGTSLLATACLLGLAWRVIRSEPDEVVEEKVVCPLEGQHNWNGL